MNIRVATVGDSTTSGISILSSGNPLPLLGGLSSLFGGRTSPQNISQGQNASTGVTSSTNVVIGGGSVQPSGFGIQPFSTGGFTTSTNPMGISAALNPAPVTFQPRNNAVLYAGLATAIVLTVILAAKFSRK